MLALILPRVVLSVSANAVQKRLLLDRTGVNHTWILTYSIMLGPAALVAATLGSGGGLFFWRDILLGGGLDAIGNLAMVAALRATDVSIFGPLNAFRPILALLMGWIFLRESPSGAGFAGVGVTLAGALILLTGRHNRTVKPGEGRHLAGVLALRGAGLMLGTAGAVFLKRAATVASAEMTVAAWIFCGLLCLVAVAFIRNRPELYTLGQAFRAHRSWLLLHAGVFVSMQWLTIRIFQSTLLAYSFVFFQLAMVLQVVVGRVFFKEPAFARRMAGAIIMAFGSALILWRG